MNEETEQLALTTAEAIARDPNARAQDRVTASRLVAQLKGQLTGRNKPSGGAGIVHVHLCQDCPTLRRADERVGDSIRFGEDTEHDEPYRWGPGMLD